MLQYWKKCEIRLPRIARLARAVLAIPASSAGCERAFSVIGNLWRSRRASLSVERVEQMMFIRSHQPILHDGLTAFSDHVEERENIPVSIDAESIYVSDDNFESDELSESEFVNSFLNDDIE